MRTANRTVNIIGMGPCAAHFDPHKTPGETWGINYAYLSVDYLDRLFMFHPWEQFVFDAQKPERRHKFYLQEIQNNIGQIWTIEKLQVALPNNELPIYAEEGRTYSTYAENSDVWKTLSQEQRDSMTLLIDSNTINVGDLIMLFGADYFTCSLPYLIGQAILEGVTHLNLFGIEVWDYHETGNYGSQAKCINAWLHFARAKGVQVMIPWISAMKFSDRIFQK
jgi:hypothetical protein